MDRHLNNMTKNLKQAELAASNLISRMSSAPLNKQEDTLTLAMCIGTLYVLISNLNKNYPENNDALLLLEKVKRAIDIAVERILAVDTILY